MLDMTSAILFYNKVNSIKANLYKNKAYINKNDKYRR